MDTIRPPTCESLFYRECARLEIGERDEALTDFDRAIALKQHAEYSSLYYKRAFVCHLLGRYAEAILNYSMFIGYGGNDLHKGYLGRSLVYTDLIDYNKALKDIQKDNRLSPKENISYQYYLLRAQINLGRKNEAKTTFHQLKATVEKDKSNPNDSSDGHFYCGVALYDLNESTAALEEFEKTLECRPNEQQNGEIHFYMGLIYHSLGQISKAEEEIEQTLKINKNPGRSLFQLGLMNNEDQKSLPLVMEYLSRAHVLLPHKSEILYERGEVSRRMDQLNASLNDKRRAMQMQQSENNSLPNRNDYEVRERRSRGTEVEVFVLLAFTQSSRLVGSSPRRIVEEYHIERSNCS